MSMFEKRVDAAVREYDRHFDVRTETVYGAGMRRTAMAEAIRAADAVCCTHPKCPGGSLCCCQSDAVVTEEQIAVTICAYLGHTGGIECEGDIDAARAILALFRGGAK